MSTITFSINCAHSGNDLRGVPVQGSCPVCGRPVGGTIDLALVDAVTTTVADDAIGRARGAGMDSRTSIGKGGGGNRFASC